MKLKSLAMAATIAASGLAGLATAPAAFAQASLLVFEWMELKRTHRSGLIAGGIAAFLFLSLLLVLVTASRSVLMLSVR